MKRIDILAAAAMAAMVFASCSKDETTPKGNEGPKEINLISTIDGPAKRAVDASWTQGDRIGLYMVDAGEDLADASISQSVKNLPYTNSAGTNAFEAVGMAAYFPAAIHYVDFYAYYPHTESITADYKYPVNVSEQSSQEGIDLLYSDNVKNLNESADEVPLNFVHMLTKLVFVIKAGEGIGENDISNIEVSIEGMNTTSAFSLVNGTLGTAGTPAPITALTTNSGTRSEAIILPATVTGGKIKFDLKNSDDDVFVWNIPAATEYKAGSRYTYTVSVEREGVDITGSITNWNDENGGTIIPL